MYSQHVEVIKFDRLEEILNQEKEQVTIINFWATWCAPCIKEMPHFEELGKKHNGSVQVIFVSLDFVEKLKKVEKFLVRKNIESKVLLLDDIDYNSWIDKVDRRWSGAIPATLILSPEGKRIFIGQEVTKEELFQSVETLLNP